MASPPPPGLRGALLLLYNLCRQGAHGARGAPPTLPGWIPHGQCPAAVRRQRNGAVQPMRGLLLRQSAQPAGVAGMA